MRPYATATGLAAAALVTLAACVGNPGPFDVTMHAGSVMRVEDTEQAATFVLDIGSPACSDGQDNDLDGLVDVEDAECSSPTDANERIAGAQASSETVLPIEIDGAGTITADSSEFIHQESELCPIQVDDQPWCLGLTVSGIGQPETGVVTPDGISIPWDVEIAVRAVTGFDDLGDDCVVGPISSTLTGSDYDEMTGVVALEADPVALSAVTDCGPWTAGVNAFLELPATGAATINATILDANGNPIDVTE